MDSDFGDYDDVPTEDLWNSEYIPLQMGISGVGMVEVFSTQTEFPTGRLYVNWGNSRSVDVVAKRPRKVQNGQKSMGAFLSVPTFTTRKVLVVVGKVESPRGKRNADYFYAVPRQPFYGEVYKVEGDAITEGRYEGFTPSKRPNFSPNKRYSKAGTQDFWKAYFQCLIAKDRAMIASNAVYGAPNTALWREDARAVRIARRVVYRFAGERVYEEFPLIGSWGQDFRNCGGSGRKDRNAEPVNLLPDQTPAKFKCVRRPKKVNVKFYQARAASRPVSPPKRMGMVGGVNTCEGFGGDGGVRPRMKTLTINSFGNRSQEPVTREVGRDDFANGQPMTVAEKLACMVQPDRKVYQNGVECTTPEETTYGTMNETYMDKFPRICGPQALVAKGAQKGGSFYVGTVLPTATCKTEPKKGKDTYMVTPLWKRCNNTDVGWVDK